MGSDWQLDLSMLAWLAVLMVFVVWVSQTMTDAPSQYATQFDYLRGGGIVADKGCGIGFCNHEQEERQ